jgi:hypothetical protein
MGGHDEKKSRHCERRRSNLVPCREEIAASLALLAMTAFCGFVLKHFFELWAN